jgi:hypothetical protein
MAFLDHNGESEFPINKNQVFDAMCIAIPTIKGMKVENADKLQGRILVKAGVSLYSWGENIPIQLLGIDENKTKVQITSSPKTGIMFGGAFDMGKNRKNIENILSATSTILQRNINQQSSQQNQPTNYQTTQTQPAQNFSTMAQSEQPKKKMGLGKKILIGLGILIVIGIIANSGKDKSTTTNTNSTSGTNTSSEPAKAKQWTEVFTVKGSGLKKTASFTLSGAKARVKYKYTTGDMGIFSFYVVPEGEDIMKTGGIPDVMIQQSETSETYITKDAGTYYLNINSSGGSWTITVEEEK